jgi:hypothetical protein
MDESDIRKFYGECLTLKDCIEDLCDRARVLSKEIQMVDENVLDPARKLRLHAIVLQEGLQLLLEATLGTTTILDDLREHRQLDKLLEAYHHEIEASREAVSAK